VEKTNNAEINFVETYLIEEVKELIHDNDKLDEYQTLIKKIGIKSSLSSSTVKSPIPFMPLTAEMRNTFQTLCPSTSKIKDFDKTPIPLAILKLINMSIEEKYFSEIEIWHDYKAPDPVAIGCAGYFYAYNSKNDLLKTDDGYTIKFNTREEAQEATGKGNSVYFSEQQQYIIGRWADVKASFPELQQRAKERYLKEITICSNKAIVHAQTRVS